MKVYAVIGYDVYYPRPNNIIEAFTTLEEAQEARNRIFEEDKLKDFSVDHIEIITINVKN